MSPALNRRVAALETARKPHAHGPRVICIKAHGRPEPVARIVVKDAAA